MYVAVLITVQILHFTCKARIAIAKTSSNVSYIAIYKSIRYVDYELWDGELIKLINN